MKIKKIWILVFFSGLFISSCSKDKETFKDGFESVDALVKDFAGALFAHNTDQMTKDLVHREEYIKLIHPYSDAGDIKHGGIDGLTYWKTFIINRRDLIINTYLINAKGKNCRVEKIGKPSKVINRGKVKFIREVEFTYSCEDKDGTRNSDSDNQLFGVIAEKAGKYKLLNSFND